MVPEGEWLVRLAEVNRAGQAPAKVCIAHLHPGEVSTSFARSIQNTMLLDLANHRRLISDSGAFGMISTQQGAGRIDRGRNAAVTDFLDRPHHADADYLLFADSDMGWDHDSVEVLAQSMDDTGHPIIGGLCFGTKPVGLGDQEAMDTTDFPTLYRWIDGAAQPGFDTAFEYPPDQIVEISATGAAFLMIRRSCLEAIRAAEGADCWFDLITVEDGKTGRTFGEDMSFCMRARAHGFPVHVHTGVRTSHMKDRWITESSYRESRRPASSAVTVVIPVKDRFDLTRSLVSQLLEQGGWNDLLIFDNGSSDPEMVAWLQSQQVATVFDASGKSIHEMWNAGIDEALRLHGGLADVVILNNDLDLGPRFCQRLIGGMRDTAAAAVSGNYDARKVGGVQPVRGICAGRYDGTGGLAGFAFALRAEWVATGYRFPSDLAWYFGDNDLCLSIEEAGGWYGIVGDARLTHIDGGGQTSGSLIGPTYQADEAAFRAKWERVAA